MAVNTTVEVVLPAMGESVTEGTVLAWHVREGEAVWADQTLVEVSTDKVDAEVPAPAAGTLVRIHAAEGDAVSVGEVLAEIAAGDGGTGSEAPEAGGAPGQAAGDGATGDGATGDGAQGEIVDIVTPGAGESVTEGTLLEWHVAEGDTVRADQTVCEISTDKVDVELPAPRAGTITELLASEGDTVTVGQVIARLRTGAGEPAAEGQDTSSGNGGATVGAVPSEARVSPVARRVAAAEGVDLSAVRGSGPQGRITRADVEAARSGDGASPATAPAPVSGTATELKGAAAMLARYMDESRSIPTATSFRTLTVTTLAGRREELKAAGHRVSFTHLIAYAIAKAVQDDMPVMAHHFADHGKPTRVDDGQVNLGIAVDVEKKDGSRTLMVPVICDAGRLPFSRFVDAFGDLITRARDNKLTADDLSGANISLTNPGGIGTVASVPRLMVGQGTIVATGSIDYPVGLGAIGAQIGAEKVMSMTSTYDHRVIQGAESGRFLKVIEERLQGEHAFYEELFADLGVQIGPAPRPPAPQLEALAPAPAATPDGAAAPGMVDEELLQAVQAATSLVKAHRTHGHLAARLDPLQNTDPEGDPALDPGLLHLTPELQKRIPAKVLRIHVPGQTLADALPHLRETYCGTIAYESEHISSHRQRTWLREKIESGAYRAPLRREEESFLLDRLIRVDAFERFMHKAYLGQKQFSVEGLDMTVPMLDELIQLAAAHGAREVIVGMAHRGRLNVLAHNLGRPYDTIFAEFEGASTLDAITTIPQGGTGDVKYHHGAQGSYQVSSGDSVLVNLESNPSHLEFVHPVVVGASRAAQTTRQGPHPHQDTNAAVPVVLHGDAAFPGQGVVAEALNLQGLDGYKVGGTIHLIQNNQVGFTTAPDDSRSTRMASDLAKGFDVPIIHVNADDVAACVSALRLAFAF
ncbi:MAG: 2-oxo acid dehydrogenase subunit E2, partial [Actinomycetota bacterium]|nr:2-oxo acid dehydrogenase subunit E2 [Actinomycetota bacterium]